MTWDKKVASGISVAGAIVVNLLGGWDMAVYILCVAMLLDYFTGILVAIKQKKLSSSVGIDGIFKKVMILCLIMLAVLVDDAIGGTGAIRLLVLMFYIGMEGISVLENAAAYGIPVPEKLKDALIQLKEQGKKTSVVVIDTHKETISTETVTTTDNKELK